MSADGQLAPVIIKKVKKSGGDGHHGGAWKVAYADFVTAMMAFFLLMWLLNATTEKQRKGLADYFSPTIAVARVSGGGDGSLGGDSVMTEETRAKNGQGATALNPTEANMSKGLEGKTGQKREQDDEELRKVEEDLFGTGGESMVAENALKHVMTRLTDEGLVIELFSLPDRRLWVPGTAEPAPVLVDLARILHGVTKAVSNPIAVEGHVPSQPIVAAQNDVWQMSSARADGMRELLGSVGMDPQRIIRVTGHADRELNSGDIFSVRNERLEIILVRTDTD